MNQDITVCSVTDCGRKRSRREYCSGHYKQALNGEELRPLRERVRNTGSCAFDGCDKPFRSKGLCGTHYGQYIKGEQLRQLGPKPKPLCSQDECQSVASSSGLCQRHYQKQWMEETAEAKECRVEWCDSGARFVKEQLCSAHYQQKRAGKEFTPPKRKGGHPCKFPDCANVARTKGLCSSHDNQRRKGRDLTPIRSHPKYGPICMFNGCGVETRTAGYCSGHYAQKRKGQALVPIDRTPKQTDCGYKGCEKPYSTSGYCRGHYSQTQRGVPLTPLKVYKVRGPVRTTEQVMYRDDKGNKQCVSCKAWKPDTEYFKSHVPSDGLVPSCKACIKQEPYNHPTAIRAKTLKGVYNITPEEWEALFSEQGNQCASCGTRDPGPKGWCVDHDHSCCPGGGSCGECIRGILCQPCNLALGIAKDDATRLRSMADYLDAWKLSSTVTLVA